MCMLQTEPPLYMSTPVGLGIPWHRPIGYILVTHAHPFQCSQVQTREGGVGVGGSEVTALGSLFFPTHNVRNCEWHAGILVDAATWMGPLPHHQLRLLAPLDGNSEVPEIMAAHKFDGIRFHFLRSPTKTPTETQNTHSTKYTPLKLWISEMSLTKITGYFGLVKYDKFFMKTRRFKFLSNH